MNFETFTTTATYNVQVVALLTCSHKGLIWVSESLKQGKLFASMLY